MENKKAKLKKGDYVRIDPPMVGQISRVYKGGTYSVKVLPSRGFEVARYDDSEIYKLPKSCNMVKNSLEYEKMLNS